MRRGQCTFRHEEGRHICYYGSATKHLGESCVVFKPNHTASLFVPAWMTEKTHRCRPRSLKVCSHRLRCVADTLDCMRSVRNGVTYPN